MTAHTHWDAPHALYRMFDRAGQCLYIGCSYAPCSRLAVHRTTKEWITTVASITLQWFPNEILGRRAEAAAILAEHPVNNSLRCDPDHVGMATQAAQTRKPRGDGVSCPKCGNEIENARPGKAYCNSCFREYRRERRLRAVATPKEP